MRIYCKIVIMVFLIIFLSCLLNIHENNVVFAKKTVSGLLKKVDLNEKKICIGTKVYYINEKSIILHNGRNTSLKACLPPAEGIYQYSRAIVNDRNEIIKLHTFYRVVEGIIKKVNEKEDYIILDIFSTPEIEEGEKKVFFNIIKENNNNFSHSLLKKGEHLVMAIGDSQILFFHKVY